ncbi:histidine phosphatase family protein [Streptomyces zaomyceticus]|uniref:TIGR04222 domain-containing membrane protein n=1 Tax=Streptomyces zaomyceticus TaxID=68286 RepID=A0ABZ1LNG3_9ACTN|nr:hypothetical protein OG237_01325 [Streptomyces zaomyceticus]
MDWWLTDGEGIVAGWVLVFAVCNGLRGAYCWLRDRDERRTVEQLMAGNLPPLQASFLLDGMAGAAETAVCMLVDDGVVKVSSTGELRTTHRGRKQMEPALRALAKEIRSTPPDTTTKLYEIPTAARFARFRELVEHEAPKVRSTSSGRSQTLMLAASMVIAFAMGMHGGLSEAPVPFVPEADRSVWLYVAAAAWAVLWGPACLWPSEKRRRWKALDRYCEDEREIARAALPDHKREAIARTREQPPPPPPPARAPRVRNSTPQRSGSWADSVDVDACGSCGGCGGD